MYKYRISSSRVFKPEIPIYIFAPYRSGIENDCIDVIKFSDKNRWRRGKIALGLPRVS